MSIEYLEYLQLKLNKEKEKDGTKTKRKRIIKNNVDERISRY